MRLAEIDSQFLSFDDLGHIDSAYSCVSATEELP